MKLQAFLLAASLLTFASSSVAQLTTGCSNGQAVVDNSVDLVPTKYDGVWYEQARSKSFSYDYGCYCTMANYTLNTDGSIKVDNSCHQGSAKGPISTATGKAVVANKNHPGFLHVSFGLPFLQAPYAVVDVDYDEYSIVVSCPRFFGKGYVWILTRSQHVDTDFLDGLMNKTADMGFPRADLTQTYQGPDCNSSFHETPIEEVDWSNYYVW